MKNINPFFNYKVFIVSVTAIIITLLSFSAAAECIDGSGDVVVIENTTYIDTAECIASRSLTIGPDVYIESGADVSFSAPVVTLKSPFMVFQGANFRVSTFPYTIPEDTLEWASVDVSLNSTQGDAHVISKNGKHILIDAGIYEAGKQKLLTFLRERQIDTLDAVYVSHPHLDHYGGVKALFEANIEIKSLYMNFPTEAQMDREWWGGTFQELLDIKSQAESSGTPLIQITPGDQFVFDEFTFLEVLYVYDGINTPVGETDINDMSAVMMMYDGDKRFLFTGDLNNRLGEWLAINADDIQADILKVPHHGTEGLAPDSFFMNVNPIAIIVPSPKELWCSERSSRVRNLAVEMDYQTWINGWHGNITVFSDDNGLKVYSALNPQSICISN